MSDRVAHLHYCNVLSALLGLFSVVANVAICTLVADRVVLSIVTGLLVVCHALFKVLSSSVLINKN